MKDEKKEELAEIKNSSQKQIVVNALKTKSNVDKKEHKHYTFYEIEPGKKVVFHLDVIKAKNKEATAQNVYWVAQSNDKFKSKEWLPFERVENAKPLHELLNELNQGTIYDKETLEDGSYNEDYHRYTLQNTRHVGLNYCPTNPYENRFEFREKPQGEVYGELKYIGDVPGRGIWLEGINYHPEFGNQGAFIMVVDKPQILSFYVEKRHWKEREVDEMGVIKLNTETVEEELAYGDILDLHLCTHNTFGYTIFIDILCEGKSVLDGEYKKIIKRINLDKENPSKDYNLEFLEEQVIDLRWIKKTGHREATSPQQSSIKKYTLKLVLEPHGDYTKDRKTITREVTFNVNYKNEFSADTHESKYIAQIAQVHKPPLITQSFETCHYSELTIKRSGDNKRTTILKEQKDGSLKSDISKTTTTPLYNLVLGNKDNGELITISVKGDVSDCKNEEKHQNNIFDTNSITPISYTPETFWDRIAMSSIFPEVQPYKEISRSEKKLKFKAYYPYNSINEHTFLFKYLHAYLLYSKIIPVHLPVIVKSCRYTRTALFKIYPDITWAFHFNFDTKKILYYDNIEVPLVKGDATFMSYVAKIVNWAKETLKPIFIPYGKKEEGWQKIEEAINSFVEESTTYMHVGFHARYDIKKGEQGKILNYSQIQPYKANLHYFIFQVVVAGICLELFIAYLTGGKVSPTLLKLSRLAKKVKKAQKAFKNIQKMLKDEGVEVEIETPRISSNFGIHKQMQKNGALATIIKCTIQAKPLLAINGEYEFEPELLTHESLKKFKLKAEASGKISYDFNLNYNTYTGEFTLNKNAKDQEGEYNKVLRDGDLIKQEGYIAITIKAAAEFEEEFNLLWKLVPIDVQAKGEIELHTSVGVIDKIGYTPGRGLFIEKIFYFGGLKGTYSQKVELRFKREEIYNSNSENKKSEKVTIFEPKNYSLGKIHLFDLFTPTKEHQVYENK